MISSSASRVLIAEPDPSLRWLLRRNTGPGIEVTASGDFATARVQLLTDPPDILVTNVRLAAYNGLHLVILARSTALPTRCLVHAQVADAMLVREAHGFGAFFETTHRLVAALPSYLQNPWPASDRRNPMQGDRRTMFRGGRRASDLAALMHAPT